MIELDVFIDKKDIEVKIAERITKNTYPQVINIGDLKNCKELLYVKVNEVQSILLQYWLFFHGWRTTKRYFTKESGYRKLDKIRKSKEFESLACTVIVIRPDKTFYSSIGGLILSNGLCVDVNVLLGIFATGYCYVEGRRL